MIGTLINVVAIIIGSLIGLAFNTKLPKRYIDTAFVGIGIFTLVLGISMALGSENQLYMVFSIIIGSIIGEFLKLDQRLNDLAEILKGKLKSNNTNFTNGLITAFLLFCMGSMTILGAIDEGINGSIDLLMTKSTMDGFASIALASTLGIGVLFSIVPLFIYQGGLTLLASQLQDYLSQAMITEISAVGGLLLIALAFNILKLKEVKVTNMLPSLIIIILFTA